jgi:hypothetical protein
MAIITYLQLKDYIDYYTDTNNHLALAIPVIPSIERVTKI